MATKPKRPRDVNQLAKLIVDLSTGEAEEQKNDKNKKTFPNKKIAPSRKALPNKY